MIYLLARFWPPANLRPLFRTGAMNFFPRQLVVALLLAAIPEALANGLRVVSQDAFAAARGDAFTATADNPSAIYYNPAGITQLAGDNVRGGLYGIFLNPTFNPPPGRPNSGQTYETSKRFASAPQFYFTHQLKKLPVTVGLGVYAPYGGTLEWPDATRFRAVAERSSLMYLRFNPVVAVKLCDTLSLAVGGSLDYARLNLQQGILKSANPPNFFRFTGDGFSADYNAGILWQPSEMISFGATVRGETPFTLDGSTTFEEDGAFPGGSRLARMNLTFPLTTTFGLSLRPTPQWNFECDVDYAGWDSVGDTAIRQVTAPPSGIQQNIPVHLQWQASWMFSLGVTRYFDNGWHVSAGYLFDQNSVPNKFYTPLAADLDRHFFSVGVGHHGQKIDLDFTYQLGYGPSHSVSGSQPASTPALFAGQNADGTYAFISHAVLVSAGLHF